MGIRELLVLGQMDCLDAWEQDHTFNFDNIKIVDRADNYKTWMILEMKHIASNPNSINQRTDTDNLSVFYMSLLNRKN